MKIKIVYESNTGNTKMIAEAIKEACEINNTVVFIKAKEALETKNDDKDTDLYFLGSWTDKGFVGDSMKKYVDSLENNNIAGFGTAGFGGSPEYFKDLADRFNTSLPESNKILGNFYCQGKMPIALRNRYEGMLKENPEDKGIEARIANFDAAQSHPDKNDLEDAKKFAGKIIEESKSV